MRRRMLLPSIACGISGLANIGVAVMLGRPFNLLAATFCGLALAWGIRRVRAAETRIGRSA